MKNYQKRVIKDKKDLEVKIIKLTEFLCSNLSVNLTSKQRELMQKQLYIMLQYTTILETRINDFI